MLLCLLALLFLMIYIWFIFVTKKQTYDKWTEIFINKNIKNTCILKGSMKKLWYVCVCVLGKWDRVRDIKNKIRQKVKWMFQSDHMSQISYIWNEYVNYCFRGKWHFFSLNNMQVKFLKSAWMNLTNFELD